MGPKGLIGSQRKVHASLDEYVVFRMGQSFEVFDLGFCRASTLTCHDTVFSESWRVAALKGAEVILAPHAGRKGGHGRDVPLRINSKICACIVRKCLVHGEPIASRTVFSALIATSGGFNGHSTHKGGAFIVNPHGEMIAQGDLQLEDLMITAEIEPEVYNEITRKL